MTNEEFIQKIKDLIINNRLNPDYNGFVDFFHLGAFSRASPIKKNFNTAANHIKDQTDVKEVYMHALHLIPILSSLGEETVGDKVASKVLSELTTIITNFSKSMIQKILDLQKEIKEIKNDIKNVADKNKNELQGIKVDETLQDIKGRLIHLMELKISIDLLETSLSTDAAEIFDEKLVVIKELGALKNKIVAVQHSYHDLDAQYKEIVKLTKQQEKTIQDLREENKRLQDEINQLKEKNRESGLNEQKLAMTTAALETANDKYKGKEEFQQESAYDAHSFRKKLKLFDQVLIPIEYHPYASFEKMSFDSMHGVVGMLKRTKYVKEVDMPTFSAPQIVELIPGLKFSTPYLTYQNRLAIEQPKKSSERWIAQIEEMTEESRENEIPLHPRRCQAPEPTGESEAKHANKRGADTSQETTLSSKKQKNAEDKPSNPNNNRPRTPPPTG